MHMKTVMEPQNRKKTKSSRTEFENNNIINPPKNPNQIIKSDFFIKKYNEFLRIKCYTFFVK